MSSTAQSTWQSSPQALAVTPAGGGRAPVLYLLSGDDGLLLELGPLLGARYRTRPIDSAEQLAPPGAGPWALLIDATARTDARAQAARIKQQYPQAPLLIICAGGAAPDWASPLSRGTISAVVERGALGAPEFAAALDSADQQMQAAAIAAAAPAATASATARFWSVRALIALATLGSAVAAWHFLDGAAPGAPRSSAAPAATAAIAAAAAVAAAAPTTGAAAPGRTVLELLSDARVAFSDEKRQLPPADGAATADNALELYARVLTQDPQNEEARDGMRRLLAVGSARIRADLAAGRFDDANRLLAAFQGPGLADTALAPLQSELAAARPRWLTAQARAAIAGGDVEAAGRLMTQLAAAGAERATLAELQHSMDAQQAGARLVALARRVHAQINAGALLEPAADSAQALVQAMVQLNRDHPLTLGAQRELQAALAERSRAQQEAAAARERAAASAPTDTMSAPASAVAAPSDDFVRARPVAPLAVTYPQQAFDAGQQGYVIVEFTLSTDGRAGNSRVVESSPPAVFDGAALQAVRRGRFDTSALGVPGKPRLARLRISFRQ